MQEHYGTSEPVQSAETADQAAQSIAAKLAAILEATESVEVLSSNIYARVFGPVPEDAVEAVTGPGIVGSLDELARRLSKAQQRLETLNRAI